MAETTATETAAETTAAETTAAETTAATQAKPGSTYDAQKTREIAAKLAKFDGDGAVMDFLDEYMKRARPAAGAANSDDKDARLADLEAVVLKGQVENAALNEITKSGGLLSDADLPVLLRGTDPADVKEIGKTLKARYAEIGKAAPQNGQPPLQRQTAPTAEQLEARRKDPDGTQARGVLDRVRESIYARQ